MEKAAGSEIWLGWQGTSLSRALIEFFAMGNLGQRVSWMFTKPRSTFIYISIVYPMLFFFFFRAPRYTYIRSTTAFL
ncbi:hypothetical protein BJ165DRAFT_1443091 [Panaeolus papilionaceus]|nr:hypothetical protein BJ165DRAFT_1443091 [Panaeolus papilionaceus]